MKILVLGSAGMLGHVVTLYLREQGYEVADVSKRRRINEKTILLNILDENVLSCLLIQNFDVVINCAALLVKASEENKPEAILLNAYFPHMLEEMLAHTKTRIIHMSTDGVFSGGNAPYTETAKPDAELFYGRTKGLGELKNEKDLTVRASVVGGDLWRDGTGLFHWFVKQKGFVNGYQSTFFNAVTSLEFAKFAEYAIHHPISGIFHLGAAESISKADFLCAIKQSFQLADVEINKIGGIKTNHTLINTRFDINYVPKRYDKMLVELKQWMDSHAELYRSYNFLRR